MIDARSEGILLDIVRRETRSLLQYVSDSFPWTTLEERNLLHSLQEIIGQEQQHTAELVHFLYRHHIAPPSLGNYPAVYTEYNYISLEHLLPKLLKEQQSLRQALEQDLADLTDPKARSLAQQLLALKTSHLETLQKLAAQAPEKQHLLT